MCAWWRRGLAGRRASCQGVQGYEARKRGADRSLPSKEESGGSACLSCRLPLTWCPGSWHLLLGRRLVAAALTSSLSREIGDIDRLLQREIEARLRGDFHLLALGEDLDARSRASTDRCTDRRAFAAAGNCADQSPKSGTAADGCSAALAAGCARLFHVAGFDVVGPALKNNTSQSQREFAAAGNVAGGTSVD